MLCVPTLLSQTKNIQVDVSFDGLVATFLKARGRRCGRSRLSSISFLSQLVLAQDSADRRFLWFPIDPGFGVGTSHTCRLPEDIAFRMPGKHVRVIMVFCLNCAFCWAVVVI